MKNNYYSYDMTKVINIVLFITQSFGNRIHLLLLNKLLYTADILHLTRYGYFLTKDKYICMGKGLVPINSYFLYIQLIENKSWLSLPYNLHEFFFMDGSYLHCHQKYNGDILSTSEVNCLFEAIRLYKQHGASFLNKTHLNHISTSAFQFNEFSILDIAKVIGLNDSIVQYIQTCQQTELYYENEEKTVKNNGKKKLNILSAIIIGTVLTETTTGNMSIIAGMSFSQYLVVSVLSTGNLDIDLFFDDLKKSFLSLSGDYEFLQEASFVNCSQLHIVSHDTLYGRLITGTTGISGCITQHDTDRVYSAIQEAATIPAYIKEELVVNI